MLEINIIYTKFIVKYDKGTNRTIIERPLWEVAV